MWKVSVTIFLQKFSSSRLAGNSFNVLGWLAQTWLGRGMLSMGFPENVAVLTSSEVGFENNFSTFGPCWFREVRPESIGTN